MVTLNYVVMFMSYDMILVFFCNLITCRCLQCGIEVYSKTKDFCELELNVKELKNLDASLYEYLNVEELMETINIFVTHVKEKLDATFESLISVRVLYFYSHYVHFLYIHRKYL